jgi:hypothetical protein
MYSVEIKKLSGAVAGDFSCDPAAETCGSDEEGGAAKDGNGTL